MTSERIKEIQEQTAYPESLSVKQALLQVWNECQQEHNKQLRLHGVSNRRELLFDFNEWKKQYEFKDTKPLDIVDMYLEEQVK